MNALFVLHTDKSYNTASVYHVLSEELKTLSTTGDYGQLSNYPILISVTESNIYQGILTFSNHKGPFNDISISTTRLV